MPERTPAQQRQDSLNEQLRTVHSLAVQHGCYDAADLILTLIKEPT